MVEPPFDPDYDTPASRDQRPPQDNPAEQAVLGALLLAPELATDLEPHLDPDDFYRPAHEVIWTTIHRLNQADGAPPDPVTVAAELTRTGDLHRIGGAPYLHTLMEACPNPRQAEAYARIVRDASRLRTVEATATKMRQLATTGDLDAVDRYLEQALQTLDDTVMRFGPRTTTNTNTGLHDLSWVLTGTPPVQTPPAWCHRTDGHALFYAGKVNGIFGDPESGKTWLAQAAVVEALNAGGTAAMIDVDHNGPDHTAARLALLGARWEHIADPDRFRYYEPEEADELLAAVDDITRRKPDVYLLDSLGEVLPMLGVKSVDNDEITAALRRTCTPPAAAGSCVITIDHLPKSTEARTTGYAIGGTAKKRIMRGSYLRVEVRTQPAPGAIGRSTIRIEKDTVGELRKVTPGGYAGTLVLDSTQPHVTTWAIELDTVPTTDAGDLRPTHLMEKVSRHVEQNDQATFRDIKEAVSGKDKWLRVAIRALVDEGFMTTHHGPRNSIRHHSIALYRESEDDQS